MVLTQPRLSPYQLPWVGKWWSINVGRFHPLHLFEQQGNVVDALGDDVLDVIHPQSLTQSSIYLQI